MRVRTAITRNLAAALTLLSSGLFAEPRALTQQYHQAPDKDGAYFVGPEVTAPTILHAAPALSRDDMGRTDIRGVCLLSLTIKADGGTTNIRLLRGIADQFDAAAMEAVKQSKYGPGRLNGAPVPVKLFAQVAFTQDRQPATPELVVMERDVSPKQALEIEQTGRHAPMDQPPVLIHLVEAYCPEPGKRAKYEATIMVSALVDENGIPSDLKVEHPVGLGIDQQALDAVRLYRFTPGLKDGRPTPIRVTMAVKFRIYQSEVPKVRRKSA